MEFQAAMTQQPSPGLVSLTYIIYFLHLFSAVTGVLSPALVLTAFLTGWPSLIAVILNYAKRSDTRGTYLESHFRWQIRTFWFALLWLLFSGLLFLTVIGFPLAILLLCGTGLWILYRIIRGLIRLMDELPMTLE
jgi:uncharacterized membrane protein